jgi:L-2-hydroxyglutarate oxidase LhgO
MQHDIIVIGGGIVGLATALRIKEQRPDMKILVLEKEREVAVHQTGNNSGVIHSGLYYKPGSLKATNCIKGYHQLIEFCEQEYSLRNHGESGSGNQARPNQPIGYSLHPWTTKWTGRCA